MALIGVVVTLLGMAGVLVTYLYLRNKKSVSPTFPTSPVTSTKSTSSLITEEQSFDMLYVGCSLAIVGGLVAMMKNNKYARIISIVCLVGATVLIPTTVGLRSSYIDYSDAADIAANFGLILIAIACLACVYYVYTREKSDEKSDDDEKLQPLLSESTFSIPSISSTVLSSSSLSSRQMIDSTINAPSNIAPGQQPLLSQPEQEVKQQNVEEVKQQNVEEVKQQNVEEVEEQQDVKDDETPELKLVKLFTKYARTPQPLQIFSNIKDINIFQNEDWPEFPFETIGLPMGPERMDTKEVLLPKSGDNLQRIRELLFHMLILSKVMTTHCIKYLNFFDCLKIQSTSSVCENEPKWWKVLSTEKFLIKLKQPNYKIYSVFDGEAFSSRNESPLFRDRLDANQDQQRRWLTEIFDTLATLNQKAGIIMNNLSTDSIMIDKDSNAVIWDFSHATGKSDHADFNQVVMGGDEQNQQSRDCLRLLQQCGVKFEWKWLDQIVFSYIDEIAPDLKNRAERYAKLDDLVANKELPLRITYSDVSSKLQNK
jgi:hypothetical protein